jgi:hypothetical protein
MSGHPFNDKLPEILTNNDGVAARYRYSKNYLLLADTNATHSEPQRSVLLLSVSG